MEKQLNNISIWWLTNMVSARTALRAWILLMVANVINNIMNEECSGSDLENPPEPAPMLRAIIPESIWRIFGLSFWIDIFHRRTNPPPISPFAISLWTLLRHHHIWKNVKVASFLHPQNTIAIDDILDQSRFLWSLRKRETWKWINENTSTKFNHH